MNDEKKKQIADHHDNVIGLKVESENISDEFNYIRNKAERDNLYIRTSWDRVVDMKINFYDRIIDLGMFLLKLFIPIFGISFAVGVNILGMDIYTLKCLSLLIIILVGLLIALTFLFRKRIVDSEQKHHERVLDITEKTFLNNLKDLKARIEQIKETIKLALENERNLQ